jgi:hypothetical protein
MRLDPGNGSGSGGPGLLIEGFDHHSPTGSTLTAQAETLGSSIGDIENFDSRLTSTHNTATEGLAGIIAEDLADAPATARNQAREAVQGTTVAAGALAVYATAIDAYNTNITRWNTTIGSHETAEKQREAKSRLTPQYSTAVEDLETAARTCKKHLEDPLDPTSVKSLYRAGALPSETPAIFGNLDLTLTAEDKYEHYQARIEAGEMPDFGAMTEEERLEFVEQNPDLLPYLMSIEDPDRAVKDDVLALALPHVDADDADSDIDTILAGIDGDATAVEIEEAFGDSGRIGEALALLTPWMAKNDLDASDHAVVRNVNGYLDKFTQRSWENREAIEQLLTDGVERTETRTGAQSHQYESTYFEDIFSDAEAAELRSNWADSFLAVSNEDIGGGWDSLPESMREAVHHDDGFMSGRPGHEFRDVAEFLTQGNPDLPPGDGLATELANSTAHALYNSYGSSGPPGDQEWGWHGVPDEDVFGDVLEMVSRNHEATAALFHGGEVPGFDGHLPDSHNPADFAKNIYEYRWDDDGEAAASLTDWIPEAMENGGHDEDVATKAWYGVIDSVTATDNDGYAAFGGDNTITTLMGGDGETAMTINPELANSLYRTTAANLDDLATNKPADAMVTDKDHVRLMMLLGSNPDTAQALSASIQHHQQGIAQAYIDGDHGDTAVPAEQIGMLQSKLDAGLYNAAREAGLNEVDAEKQRIATIKTGTSILSGTAGLIPNPVAGFAAGTANTLLGSALDAPKADLNAVSLPGGWADQDNGFDKADLATLAQVRTDNMLLHALGGDVGPVATDPTALASDHDKVSGAVEDAGLAPTRLNEFNDFFYQTYNDKFSWWGPDIEVETLLNGK